MATIAKNFRVKNGLVVEGTVATVNGNDILTKDQADLDYITALVGGSADSTATPDTLVLRDGNGDFAANEITAASVVLDGSDLATTLSDNDTAAQGYADDAEADAIATAAADATSKADAAQAAAEATASADATTKADNAETGAVATAAADATAKADQALVDAKAYADQAELDAISSANSYTDGRETAITTAYQGYADQAEADAISTAAADATSKANAAQSAAEATAAADATAKADAALASAESYADQAELDAVATANSYTDGEIAALIGGAPDLLNTLDEIAAAIADDENFSTTVVSDIAQGLTDAKAYTDTRETAITTAYQSYADTAEADAISTAAADATAKADAAEADAITAANSYTDGRETAITTAYQSYADQAELDAVNTAAADATSKADAALSSAQTYADTAEADAIATAASDATSKANTAESNANTYTDTTVGALTTDDIAEGTNEYYTTTRAKTDAAALLVGATKTNIEITGDENGLTITAENGVADSTTDDLAEGSNLYFTDQRAVDALEAVTPVFTEVDVNSVALQVASTVSVATQNTTGVVYSFDSGAYTSGKFIVKADTGTHTEVVEVLLTLDSSLNVAITEYAIVNTGGSLIDVTATMNGTDVELQATVVNDNTTVSATGTLIA